MKKYLFVVVALLALMGQANAQRCLPGMRGVELRGGFVDGVQKPVKYYYGVGLSNYQNNGKRWVIGEEYLNKTYAYKDLQIPQAQVTEDGRDYTQVIEDATTTY